MKRKIPNGYPLVAIFILAQILQFRFEITKQTMKKTAFLITVFVISLSVQSQNVTIKPLKFSPSKTSEAERAMAAPQTVNFTNDTTKVNVVCGRIDENGDTLLCVNLPEVNITLMNHYYEIIETRSGRRLVENVRKTYPYAKLAKEKLKEYDTLLMATHSERERKELMKKAEKEITDQYTEEITNLTLTQGAILIRLIDRETGNTSYNLVQELRGKVRAFFYQGFARLWGYNLKSEYDPKNNEEDNKIETIVTLLEQKMI